MITIPTFDIDNYHGRIAPTVRIYYDHSFTALDGTVIGAGNPEGGVVYKPYTTTLVSTTLTIPEMTIHSTRDGIDYKLARVSFYLFEHNAALEIDPLAEYRNLSVPATIASSTRCSPSGTCCSLAELWIWNQTSATLPFNTYYTAERVDQLIDANIGVGGISGFGATGRVPYYKPNATTLSSDADFEFNDAVTRLIVPVWDKGGERYVVEAYRVPAGDVESIEATYAEIGDDGGIIQLAPGSLDLLDFFTIGNGSGSYTTGAATYSTKHGIIIQGAGGGNGASASQGYSTLKYTGPTLAGPVINFAGPIFKVGLRNLVIDCNGLAEMGYDMNHVQESLFENVKVLNNTGYGMRLRGYANPTGGGNGANNNVFRQCFVGSTQSGAGGLDLGAQSTQGSPFLGVSQNTFDTCRWRFDGAPGTTTGIRLNFCDQIEFINCLTYGTNSIDVRPPSGTNGANYPQAIDFKHSALVGALVQSGAVVFAGSNGLHFDPYPIDDAEPFPAATPVDLYAGITTHREQFGRFKNQPLLFSVVTASADIANTITQTAFDKSYTVKAGKLSMTGATLRLRACGHYSTTGAPSFTLRFKLGAIVIAEALVQGGTDAAALPWVAETDAMFLFGGVLYRRCFSFFSLAGGGITAGSLQGNGAFDPTIDQAVTMTATPSVASASNSITLDSLTVEILYPGETL